MSRQRADRRTTGKTDTLALSDSAAANTLDVQGLTADLCDGAHRCCDATTVDPAEPRQTPLRQRAAPDENTAGASETGSSGALEDGGSTAADDVSNARHSRLANDETSPSSAVVALLGSAGDAVQGEHCDDAAAAGGGHYREEAAVVLVETLTHTEVDALLGPTMLWKNPFDEVGGVTTTYCNVLLARSRK